MHADALDRQEDGERLPDLVVESGVADLLDQDRVGPAQRARRSSVTSPRMRIASPGPGKGCRPTMSLRQPELAPDLPHLVLEQLAERLDQLEHPLGQAAHVVVGLDRVPTGP